MNKTRLNTYFFNTSVKEFNTQRDSKCRSNSLLHRKEFANKEYKNRISLNPLGELKLELRDQIPTYHIRDVILKTNYLNELEEIKAFDKANFESDINSQLKKQKYQLLLEKDKHINKLCNSKTKEIKTQFENRKKSLKEQLTSIIKDSLLFAKKNSPVAAMLPPGANEFFQKLSKEKGGEGEDNLIDFSSPKKVIRSNSEKKNPNYTKKQFIKKSKNEFLSLIGVDLDNLSLDNINIDIDKAWDFLLTWAKGRNVDEILRYKVVNSIMSLTEQKASEKVRLIYQKLELFNEHKKKQRKEALRKKREEEKKKKEELKKMNPKDIITAKMKESLKETKTFKTESSWSSRPKMKKKKPKIEEEVVKKEIIKLNAYDDVDEIIRFINNSKYNSQSKFCKDHFNNIKRTKTMDQNMKRLMYKNLIIERK